MVSKKRHILFLSVCVIIYALIFGGSLYAHPNAYAAHRKDSLSSTKKMKEHVEFKDRWGFRTNAFDWLMLLPNVGVEFDLSKSVYNKSTLLLNARGNWRTSNTFKSYFLYNSWDVRAEYRYYWRTSLRSANDKMTFIDKVFSRKRFHPRSWRAYYLGAYVTAGNFTLKPKKYGKQGRIYGAGISAGFGIPLYALGTGVIDFEFGANVGLAAVEYDEFTLNRNDNCYPLVGHKPLHIVPYPVLHDVQVSFVYRFGSIKNKYSRINEQKIEARQERARQRRSRKAMGDSLRAVRRLEKEAMADSIKAAKELQKALKQQMEEQKKQEKQDDKQAEESLQTIVSQTGDSLIVQPHIVDSLRLSETTSVNEKQKGKKNKKADKKKDSSTRKSRDKNKKQSGAEQKAAETVSTSVADAEPSRLGKEDKKVDKKDKTKKDKKKNNDKKKNKSAGDTACLLPRIMSQFA